MHVEPQLQIAWGRIWVAAKFLSFLDYYLIVIWIKSLEWIVIFFGLDRIVICFRIVYIYRNRVIRSFALLLLSRLLFNCLSHYIFSFCKPIYMKVDEVNKSHQIQIYFTKIQRVIAVRDWSSLKLKRHLLALKDVYINGARIWDQFGSIYFLL